MRHPESVGSTVRLAQGDTTTIHNVPWGPYRILIIIGYFSSKNKRRPIFFGRLICVSIFSL